MTAFNFPYFHPNPVRVPHFQAWEPGHLGASGYTDVLPFVPRISPPVSGYVSGLRFIPGAGTSRSRPTPVEANQYFNQQDLTTIKGLMKKPGGQG